MLTRNFLSINEVNPRENASYKANNDQLKRSQDDQIEALKEINEETQKHTIHEIAKIEKFIRKCQSIQKNMQKFLKKKISLPLFQSLKDFFEFIFYSK